MTQPCPPSTHRQRSNNSDIRGIGYGDWHAWERTETARVGSAAPEFKWTRYVCRVCGAEFKHFYDLESSIFKAMQREPVPEQCVPPTPLSKIKQPAGVSQN
jgi:hypothetical protein